MPAHYNNLAAMEDYIETMISAALAQVDHPFRKPVLATVDGNGAPKARITILRDLVWAEQSLRLHTDARSSKVKEIVAQPNVILAFYDPRVEVQIQLSGRATVHLDDDYANKAWAAASPSSLRAYLGDAMSGAPSQTPLSGLPSDVEGLIPSADRIAEGRQNFAAIEVIFDQIDWLFLSPNGNRRARFAMMEEKWVGSWLVP